METFWFFALGGMLIVYAVLDGFDLGAGVVQLLATRSQKDRDHLHKAIAPYWDGNEVWLLAGGGILVMAFPKIYASAFSGLYLPLMLVLWLLIGRAIALEFRHHFHNRLWCDFWERVFAVCSLLLTVVFGAALGNVIRGFNLDAEGYFFTPFWTSFGVTGDVGVLDWFTVLMGVTSCLILSVHSANFLSLRLPEELAARCRRLAKTGGIVLIPWVIVTATAVMMVQPAMGKVFGDYPVAWLLPLGALVSLVGMVTARQRQADGWAFACSTALITTLTLTAAVGIYPNMLVSSDGVNPSLTIWDAKANPYSLQTALLWWPVGMGLCTLYFINLYRGFWYRLEDKG